MDEYNELKPREDPNTSNNESFSKNIGNIREVKADNFEENLNISDIIEENNKIQKELDSEKKKIGCLNIFNNQSIDKDFSEDLDNINEDEFNQRKISLCSLQSEEFNCNNVNLNMNNKNNINNEKKNLIIKRESKKITKEDLNNIPLPVFSCIYCSNDFIAFKHLIQENIENKYLFQASIYDIRDINKLIIYQPILDKDDKNEKLLDIIIKNTEYIHQNFSYESINNFFKSKNFLDLCNKEFLNNKKNLTQKIEESIIKKKKDFYFRGINKIPKNSLNNKCLFNSTNSLINNCNALSGFVETNPIGSNNNNIYVNIGKINNTNSSNISINFNSISMNNNETGNCIVKDNNLLVSVVENIENNIEGTNEIEDKEEIMDFFEFDMERKIKKENIIWENNYYDIWNPIISDEDEINDESYININQKNFSTPQIKINNELHLNNKNSNNRKILNQLNNHNNYLLNLKTNEYNYQRNIEELSEKNYKLRVNLLNSKNKLKYKNLNNSINFKVKKKLNASQIKSTGSTNNSSVINTDNENKIKSNIMSHFKDFSNNSQMAIHVNTIQVKENFNKLKNNSSRSISNSKSISLRAKNLLNELISNQYKNSSNYIHIFHSIYNNKPKIKNNNTKNNFYSNSSSFNMNNKNIHSKSINRSCNNAKSVKKDIKVLEAKKTKKKYLINFKTTKGKNITKVLNTFNNSNSYINNNSSKNKKALRNKINNTTTSTSISKRTKKFSTKIIFKTNFNNKINNNNNWKNNNNSNKLILKSKKSFKLIDSHFDINKEKTSLERIRNKIYEISKLLNNKNFKGYHDNKFKMNRNKLYINKKSKNNKSNISNINELSSNNKSNNNISYISNEKKTSENLDTKLTLSNSFIKSRIKKDRKLLFKNL